MPRAPRTEQRDDREAVHVKIDRSLKARFARQASAFRAKQTTRRPQPRRSQRL